MHILSNSQNNVINIFDFKTWMITCMDADIGVKQWKVTLLRITDSPSRFMQNPNASFLLEQKFSLENNVQFPFAFEVKSQLQILRNFIDLHAPFKTPGNNFYYYFHASAFLV